MMQQRIRSFSALGGLSRNAEEVFRTAGSKVLGDNTASARQSTSSAAPVSSSVPSVPEEPKNEKQNVASSSREAPPPPIDFTHEATGPEKTSLEKRVSSQIRTYGRAYGQRQTSQYSQSSFRNDSFTERLELQRASNTWSVFLSAWLSTRDAVKDGLDLEKVMESIRKEGHALAQYFAAGRGGGGSEELSLDDKFVMSATKMVADGVANVLKLHEKDNERLSLKHVAKVGAALRHIAPEVTARLQNTPMASTVLTQGPTSMAITVAEVSSRILPVLARHAGLGASVLMEEAITALRHRVSEAVNAILPKDSASWKDRMSLYQSLLKREVHLMEECFESLPPADIGSVADGYSEFRDAMNMYLMNSKIMENVILSSYKRAKSPEKTNQKDEEQKMSTDADAEAESTHMPIP